MEAIYIVSIPNYDISDMEGIIKRGVFAQVFNETSIETIPRVVEIKNEGHREYIIDKVEQSVRDIEKKERRREQVRMAQRRFQEKKKKQEAEEEAVNSVDISEWTLLFGKYKGETYESIWENNPSYLKWLFKQGVWDNTDYPSNAIIKNYIKTNYIDN